MKYLGDVIVLSYTYFMTTDHPKLRHLKNLSVLMDSKFSGPFGFKFGLDGILGLIPFVGDFIGAAISLYIIVQAAWMGCGPSLLMRMGLNLLLEQIIELIPVFGNVFDFVWKANNKNIEILESHVLNPQGATFRARLVLGFIAFTLLGIFIASIAVSIYLISFLIQLF